jgi:hypothetical protein
MCPNDIDMLSRAPGTGLCWAVTLSGVLFAVGTKDVASVAKGIPASTLWHWTGISWDYDQGHKP